MSDGLDSYERMKFAALEQIVSETPSAVVQTGRDLADVMRLWLPNVDDVSAARVLGFMTEYLGEMLEDREIAAGAVPEFERLLLLQRIAAWELTAIERAVG